VAGVAALVGAKAAHALQEPERRDHWLEVARESPSGTLAAGLLSAEIALDEDRPDDAVAEIDSVHSGKSRHIHALRLALRAYERAHDWQRALAVIGQLDKRDALPAAAIRGSKIRAYRAIFKLRGGDADAIWDVYRSLGRRDRQIIEIVDAAAHALASAGDEQRAGRLVEEALAEQVSPRLLSLYARLTSVPARDRLARAEKWRDRHGDDPALLAAMGELCLAESLWGKAEDFLQRADKLAPSRVTRQLLGMLYERTERHDEAYRYYKLAAEDASPLTPEP
jgi:HemY protein